MGDAMREARERVTRIAWFPGLRFMGEGARFAEGLDALLAARDAEWREAVERERWTEHHPMCDKAMREARVSGCCGMAARNAALDALLAAMEGK